MLRQPGAHSGLLSGCEPATPAFLKEQLIVELVHWFLSISKPVFIESCVESVNSVSSLPPCADRPSGVPLAFPAPDESAISWPKPSNPAPRQFRHNSTLPAGKAEWPSVGFPANPPMPARFAAPIPLATHFP